MTLYLPWEVSGTWFHTLQGSALRTSSRVVSRDIPAGCMLGWANPSSIPQSHKDTSSITPWPAPVPQLLRPAPHNEAAFTSTHSWKRSLEMLFLRRMLRKANFSLCPSLPGHPHRTCVTVGLWFVISGQVWGGSIVAEFCNLHNCADISEL